MMILKINDLLEQLWRQYILLNPQAHTIYKLFCSTDTVINDHIAIRTFNHASVKMSKLIKHFTINGYTIGQHYSFEQKKLSALHLEHEDPSLPKIFISELKLEQCSDSLQREILNCLSFIEDNAADDPSILFSGRHWTVNHKVYETLRSESEYAAWMYVWGFMTNHFTVKVNDLKHFTSVDSVNLFLESKGYSLNSSGGKIKGSPRDLLEQSSTLAEMKEVSFSDGIYSIPCCFYEFAFRYCDLQNREFSGFLPESADKIFQSTDQR